MLCTTAATTASVIISAQVWTSSASQKLNSHINYGGSREIAVWLRGARTNTCGGGMPALRMARRLPWPRGACGVAEQQGLIRECWGACVPAQHQGVPEVSSRRLCHAPVPGTEQRTDDHGEMCEHTFRDADKLATYSYDGRHAVVA